MEKVRPDTTTILIVDDDFYNRQLLELIVSKENYRTLTAENGHRAVQIARETVPDLILLDIKMPEMNGFEVCEKLKSFDETRDIPIIFISALDDRESISKGIELGAFDYFTKPINQTEIQVKINNCLRSSQLERKYRKDLSRRKKTEKIVRIISEETTGKTGVQFLESLLSNVCDVLNMDLGFVGELRKESNQMLHLASVCSRVGRSESLTGPWSGFPGLDVHQKNPLIYPERVRDQFPEDRVLSCMETESLIGIPLLGGHSKVLGILGILHSEPVEDPVFLTSVLKAFAVRAAAELERMESERVSLESLIESEIKERERIAHNLHEELGPLLSTAKLYLKSIESASNPENREYALDKSGEIIEEAIDHIRNISNAISPRLLQDFGLESAVSAFVSHLCKQYSYDIQFVCNLSGRYRESFEMNLFRIIVELIQNSIVQTHMGSVVVELLEKEGFLLLRYSEDRPESGINLVRTIPSGSELSKLSNRVRSMKGELKIDQYPEGGYISQIRFRLGETA